MEFLTKKEAKLLNEIEYILRYEGYMPSYTELGKKYGVTKMAICKMVNNIKQKGYLTENKIYRHLVKNTTLPFVGRIAAGSPIEALEVVDSLELDRLLNLPNLFLLEVAGNSMIESGILDGDLILVQQRKNVKNGDIIVALIDKGKATLKEICINPDDTITLIPHNDMLDPETYDSCRIDVQGVYCGARFNKACF